MTHPHHAPAFVLAIGGRDLGQQLASRLIRLRLEETRGEDADQLDIELSDHDGRLAIPPKGETLMLQMGWQGQLIDKGSFIVDETEHTGTPDVLKIRARSADMKRTLKVRREQSHHGTTVGAIVSQVATRHGLAHRIAPDLAAEAVAHIDQTHESDLHFLTRLGRQHDAVAAIKKGHLIFQRINSSTTASGHAIAPITLTRAAGDQHRWHTAERDSYSGVRAQWQDNGKAKKRSVQVGAEDNTKRLRDVYGSEDDAMHAARAEMQRIERGESTFELTLALGRPDIAPQTPVTVEGFKAEINATAWLVKKCTHTLDGSQGLTTQIELETQGSDKTAAPADDE